MIPADIILIALFVVMSIVAIIVTCRDKRASKSDPRHRVPEGTLMLIAFFFGGLAMYITMKLIRHKTKHAKFMVGIPLIILLHAGLVVLYLLVIRPSIAA